MVNVIERFMVLHDMCEIMLPERAKILSAQANGPYTGFSVLAMLNPNERRVNRCFVVKGTLEAFNVGMETRLDYIASNGDVHLFELVR